MKALRKLANRFGLYTQGQVKELSKREANANFQTALISRLTQSWTQTTLTADAQARMDLPTCRARIRQLRDNNDYARKFCTMLKTNILGDKGIHYRSKIKDPDRVEKGKLVVGNPDVYANKVVADAWYRWGRKQYCTKSGKLTFCDVERIVLETVAVDGEVLIRKLVDPDNPFGFSLQILEADYLDDQMNEIAANGNEVRMGVEIDKWGKPVAYHLLTYTTSDLYFSRNRAFSRYRVPANEIIHLFIPYRAGQTRGMPWMVTAAYRLNMLGKYEEAEVTAARVAASKMGFLSPENGNAEYTGEEDDSGNKMMDAEPGALEQLPYGMKLQSLDWQHPNAAYQFFMKTSLRGVAAGLGVSYNSLANDMESVNFASGKLGLDDERNVYKALQYWLIESFHEEIYSAWLEMALTAGAIPLPLTKYEKFNAPEFRGRRWSYINPQQEVTAHIAALNAGLTSHSRILAELGIDRDELFDEIAEDKQAAEDRDLEFLELKDDMPVEPVEPATE